MYNIQLIRGDDMERIDLNDKLLHGIMVTRSHNDEIDVDRKIRKLESILSSGYLYCLNSFVEKDIDNVFKPFAFSEFWNDHSTVSLSVVKESKYSHCGSYIGNDAFDEWTNKTFYLIFCDQLFNDFFVEKGFFQNEYYLTGNIPIDKYLVGIGNVKVDIFKKELYYEKLRLLALKYNIKLFDSNGFLIDNDVEENIKKLSIII